MVLALTGTTNIHCICICVCIFKNWFMLSMRISSYGCMQEVWRTALASSSQVRP